MGRSCRACGCFYASVNEDNWKVIKVRQDEGKSSVISANAFAQYCRSIRIDVDEEDLKNGRPLKKRAPEDQLQGLTIQKTREEKREYDRVRELPAIIPPSTEFLISLDFGNRERTYCIVFEAKDEDQENSFCYESEEGREILTAAYRPERKRQGVLKGEIFTVASREVYNKKHTIMPDEIQIGSGGGYKMYIKNPHYEKIVHLLLYSPFSNRYEVIRGTWYAYSNKILIDMGLYRRFCEDHGNPGVWFPLGRKSYSDDWDDLQTESVLKEFGYSVSEINDLGERYRRQLLIDIIDLGIITKRRTLSFLEFFIRTHPKNFNAQQKWISDRNWLMDYRENPERFLIARH